MTLRAVLSAVGSTIPDAQGRMRINAESAILSSGTLTTCATLTTCTTCTTCATVTNLSQMGTLPMQSIINMWQNTDASTLRRNITVT